MRDFEVSVGEEGIENGLDEASGIFPIGINRETENDFRQSVVETGFDGGFEGAGSELGSVAIMKQGYGATKNKVETVVDASALNRLNVRITLYYKQALVFAVL